MKSKSKINVCLYIHKEKKKTIFFGGEGDELKWIKKRNSTNWNELK